MADSDTLRALQARLAEQLDVMSQEAGRETQWLAVKAANRNYLIPLAQAGEIFPWQTPLRLPYTQPWFLGVANLRGSLVGVIDVALFLGHPAPKSGQRLQQANIVTVHTSLEMNAGIVVDQLLGLRGLKSEWRETPALDTHPHLGKVGYVDGDGVQWHELQLRSMVASQDFLNVRL